MSEGNPDKPDIQPDITEQLKEPIAITIFGILNIAIGGLTLLTSPCTIFGIAMSGEIYGMAIGYRLFVLLTYVAGLILYVWLLSLGMGLIMLKKWARRGSVIYGCVAILLWVLHTGIDFFALSAGWINPSQPQLLAFIVRMCFRLAGLIYPVLLVVFMQKAKVKEAFAPIEE